MAGISIGSDGTAGPVSTPAVVTGNVLGAFLFCASARGSVWGEAEAEYSRKMTEVYYKGYLDKATVETLSGGNWRWRRVMFQCHSDDIIDTVLPNRMARTDSIMGHQRTMFNMNTPGNLDGYNALVRQLFQGTSGKDWGDVFLAVPDRKRNRVLMDKYRRIDSGNGFGVVRTTRDYVAVNKKIRYNEKEEGDEKEPESGVVAAQQNYSWFATPTRYSGGDVYCLDLFGCANGSTEHSLNFLAHGTSYWHER